MDKVEENRKRKEITKKREQEEVMRRDFMSIGLRLNIFCNSQLLHHPYSHDATNFDAYGLFVAHWPPTAVRKLKLLQLHLTKLKTDFKDVLSKTSSGRNLASFNEKYKKKN
jgi:hypothetical protein